MRALLVALVILAPSPVFAVEAGQEDSEFAELAYACLGEDAENFTGSRAESNLACAQMDDELAKARAEGICWEDSQMAWARCE